MQRIMRALKTANDTIEENFSAFAIGTMLIGVIVLVIITLNEGRP